MGSRQKEAQAAPAEAGSVAEQAAPAEAGSVAEQAVAEQVKAERAAPVKAGFDAAKAAAGVRRQDRVRLIIRNGTGPEGKQAVFVNANGYEVNIPREVEVIVPRAVVGVLTNARKPEFSQNGEKLGMVPRYNFQVLGGAE